MKKIIFIALAAAIIAPMFIKGPDGEPIMTVSDWIPEKPDTSAISGNSNTSQEFYRYQDENGNWQYTDRPPEGANVETVEVDTSSNVMDSVEIQPKKTTASRTPAPGVAGYVENMANVKQDAEAVQQLMDDREGQLDEALSRSQ